VIKTTTTTKTTTISTTTITTIKQKLAKAYIHVCNHESASSTVIQRAISVLTERFEHLKITLGYSYVETLSVLRELVLIYKKTQTKESHTTMVRLLSETIFVIISKENQSRVLFESAKTIGDIYLKSGLVEEAKSLLRNLHARIVSKSHKAGDKSAIKIDDSVGRTSYVFLVTFEEKILGSTTISYSETMSNLLTESILYESYTRCLKSEKNISVVISHGARLYAFLENSRRTEQVSILQTELYSLFIKNWGSVIKTRGEINHVFFFAVIKELGTESRQVTDLDHTACKSSTDKVGELIAQGQFKNAYEVALCAFQFLEHQRAYHHLQNVGYGFKLSAYMACRGFKQSQSHTIEPGLCSNMLDLSRKIIGEVLKACKGSDINFVRLKLGELNDLVGLLGAQQNYADLEVSICILLSL
jgi:hypothetical protein